MPDVDARVFRRHGIFEEDPQVPASAALFKCCLISGVSQLDLEFEEVLQPLTVIPVDGHQLLRAESQGLMMA